MLRCSVLRCSVLRVPTALCCAALRCAARPHCAVLRCAALRYAALLGACPQTGGLCALQQCTHSSLGNVKCMSPSAARWQVPEANRRRWAELRAELLVELGRLDRIRSNSTVKFVIRLLTSPDSALTAAALSDSVDSAKTLRTSHGGQGMRPRT